MPSDSEAEAKLRVVVRSFVACCPCKAINRPAAQAETKHTTSPYENSFCQLQWNDRVVPNIVTANKRSCWPEHPLIERQTWQPREGLVGVVGESSVKRR